MSTITLPVSGKTAVVSGMRGKHEDLLTSERKMSTGEAVNTILADCTLLDDKAVLPSDVLALTSPDRAMLLLEIRRQSFGDSLTAHLTCQSCQKPFSVTVDLSATEVIPVPAGYTAEGFSCTIHDTAIVFDYLDGNGEKTLLTVKDDLFTALMAVRLKSVQGVHANDHKKWLRELPIIQRQALRKAMEKTECGPELTKQADCIHCNAENSFQVQGERDFFFPTM